MGKIKKLKRTHFTDFKNVWIKGYGSVGAENRIKKLSLKVTYSLSSFVSLLFFKIYLLGSIVTIIEWVQFICSTAFQYGSHDFVAAVARRIISVSQWHLTMELDCPIETALLQLRAAVQKCFTNVLGKSQESQIQLGHHQKKCIAFSDGSAFLPTLIGRPYYDFCTV